MLHYRIYFVRFRISKKINKYLNQTTKCKHSLNMGYWNDKKKGLIRPIKEYQMNVQFILNFGLSPCLKWLFFFAGEKEGKKERRYKCGKCFTKQWGVRAWTFTFKIMSSISDVHLFLLWINVRYCPLSLHWTKFSGFSGWHFPNES